MVNHCDSLWNFFRMHFSFMALTERSKWKQIDQAGKPIGLSEYTFVEAQGILYGFKCINNTLFYYCRYSGDLKMNFFSHFSNGTALGIPGATHTEDICYIFRITDMENIIDDQEYLRLDNNTPEGKMSKTLIKLIVNFANTG